jgi:anti-sigma regulatory factor (Ser/Thr protein kinase)
VSASGGHAAALDAAERLRQIEALTDAALAHLNVEELLDELLERLCEILHVDTAAVLLLNADGSELIATAARGIEEEVRQGVRVPVSKGFAGRIAADVKPVILDRVDETTVANPLLIAKGIRAMAGVPLVDAGAVVGVLHVGSITDRKFGAEEVELLQMVADRVTGATRARLVATERGAALALQRSLLPSRLPDVPGLDLAARYIPGGGNGIGGDWYDVFMLSGGWLGVVIGDVSGHGFQAAVVMGRLRSALRAYALESNDPAEVLRRLDAKLLHFEPGEMATVLFALIDPSFTSLTVSSAGHLPPVVATPGRPGAVLADIAVDPPLGVRTGIRRHTTEVALPPGGVVCLFTDGLVERRGESIEAGLDRLLESVHVGRSEAVAVEVMAHLVGAAVAEDDIALLALHRESEDASEPLDLRLPAVPDALARLRSAARRWLAANGAKGSTADDILLATVEASTNVVEHAYGPGGGELAVRFEVADGIVTVSVRDHGQWREARGSNRGRGRFIMEQCTDELEVSQGAEGTTVVIRRAIAGAGTR